MKEKTFKIQNNCICTTEGILIEGEAYFYKEGSYKTRVVLEKVVENDEWLKLLVFFPDRKQRIEVSHLNGNYGYSGMWQLYDWNEDRMEEIEESNRMRREIVKNFSPDPKFTKTAYINSLTEDELATILIHFNRINGCTSLNEKESNLIWLSWLIGEGLLNVSDEFIFFEMSEVEFNLEEYDFFDENKLSSVSKIDQLIAHYELDKLYAEVLNKRNKVL